MGFNLGLLLILLFCIQVCSDDSGFFIRGTSNSQFGSSVALAKNFRGIGSTLVVGAPSAQNLNGDPAGAVYIINPGYRPTGAEFEAAPWNGTYGCAIYGPPGFGSVITVLDLNNDQKMDIAVSSTSQTGTVYVLFGTGGPCNSIPLGTLDGTNGFVIQNSVQANWVMGKSLGSGYVNNDQYIDLLVGGDGMVLAFAGGASNAASLGVGNAIATFNGQAANTGIGSENTISSLDISKNVDVNGDLVPDFVLLGPSVQRVYVIYGKSNPGSLTLGLGNISPYGIYMTIASSTIGSVTTADIVGDTQGDLIIGDKKLDGELYIFNGQDTATNGMALTPTTLAYKGCTALANVNEDLICNAKAVQAIVRLRKSTLTSSVTIASIQPSALSSSRGDFDGDLSQDLVVGLPLDSQNRGAVYVFWGGVEFPQTFVSIGGCFQPITAWYATQGNCSIPTMHGGTCTAGCLDGYVSVNKGATTCLYGNWTTRPCTNRGTYVPATPGSKMLLGTRVLWARRFTGEGDALIISAAAKSAPAFANAGSLLVINPSRDRYIGYEFMETNIVNASVGCILFGSTANMQFGSELVAAVDMNLDGRQDVVMAYQNATGNFWRLFIIYGKNNFCQFNVNLPDILANPGVNGFALTFPGITSINSLSSGLVNNDDNPDLLICVKPNLIYSVLSGLTYNAAFVNGFPTSGWFSKITGLNSQTAQPKFQTGVGDLTGDGIPDWAVSDAVNTRVAVFRGRSAPTTLDLNSGPNLGNYAIIFTLSGTGGTIGGLIIGDFLGNASSDLLVQLLAPKSVLYPGPVTAASTQIVWNSNIACNQQSLLGHVAGSPKDNLLCIVTGSNGKVSYVTDLTTNLTGTLIYNQGRNWLSPNTGDWDGDGALDMIVGDRDYNSGDGRGIIVWGSEMYELNNLTKCWAPIAAHHPHAVQGACVQGSPHGTLCQADCETGWYPKNKTARCFWGNWIFSPCVDRGFWVRRNDGYDLGTTLAWATGFTWNNTLLVGAPGYSAPGLSECGSIFVMPSIGERFSGIEFDSLGLVSGTSGFVINGLAAGDHLGTAMTTLDMNNDGRMDTVVSSDRDGGSVYVIYGNPNFSPTFSLNDLDGAGAGVLGFTLVNPYSSPSSYFKFGLGLGSGYYDNDNYPDLFVGCGDRILVYSGTAGGTYNANPTGSIVGPAGYFNSLGCKNCFARGADFTGDGVEDFVIIDRTSHLGFIFTGKDQPSTLDLATYGSGPIQSTGGLVYARRIVYNNPPDPENATTTVTIGHVSGTSASDIIIGNPQKIFVIEGPSSGAINNGQTSIVLDSTPSYTFGAYGGCSVVRSLGNVAGDSRDELLCAATGDVLRIKDLTSGVYDTLTGVSGRSLSHGDMDEDGIPDYFIGGVEAGGAATGVYIIWGSINNYPLDMPQLASCRANLDVNTFYVTNGNCVIPSPHGTTCHVGCIPGYVSIDDEALCWYGEWQALPCKAATCGLFDFAQLPHGDATRSVHCTPGFFGQNCEFACEYGYTPAGSIICDRASGTVAWSIYNAACQPLPCGPPNMGLIAFSVPTSSCNTKQVGQTCPYSCQNGYYPDGPLPCVAITENTTDWNYTLATCSAASCGSAIPTVNTIANSNAAASVGKCLGGVTTDGCVFACQQGYTKVGTITCNAVSVGVSQWTKNNAACQPIACPNTGPTIQSGVVGDCSNKFTGDTCSLTCNSGYSQTSQITCVATGATTTAWSGGNCQAVSCPNDPTVSNGNVGTCSNKITGDSCTVTCNNGYSLVSPLQCVGTGQGSAAWSGGDCQAIACPSTGPTIQNGVVGDCSNKFTGDTCSLTCNSGYSQTSPITCIGNGPTSTAWSGGGCQAVSCPNNPTVLHGNVGTCTNKVTGDYCTVTCHNGYSPISPLQCVGTGEGSAAWFGGNCQAVACPSINWNQIDYEVDSSRCSEPKYTGEECIFECQSSRSRLGQQLCVGTAPGSSQWQYTNCGDIPCSSTEFDSAYPQPGVDLTIPPSCPNQNELTTACTLTCKDAYSSTDNHISCVNGKWLIYNPCQGLQCPSVNLASVANADLASDLSPCTALLTEQSCNSWTCKWGYAKNGVLTCKATSHTSNAWYYPGVTCDPRPCPAVTTATLAPIPYADESNVPSSCANLNFDQSCGFTCDRGYEIVGPLKCDYDGASTFWDTAAAACGPSLCPSVNLAQIANAEPTSVSACANTRTAESCPFTCKGGYSKNGDLSCVPTPSGSPTNRWAYESVTCDAMYCFNVNLDAIPHSDHSVDLSPCYSKTPGQVCQEFKCALGYSSSVALTCTETNGQKVWNYDAVQCLPLPCSNYQTSIQNANNINCQNFHVDDECPVTCSPGYQKSGTVKCAATVDGPAWQSTVVCDAIPCPAVNFARIPHSDAATASQCSPPRIITDECSFQCQQGYAKTGELRCAATQGGTDWDYDSVSCEPIECNAVNPNLIPHSNHQLPQSCNHLVTSQECAIECALGYTKSGHLICAGTPTGSAFTYDAVTCTANICPDVNFALITHANPASSCPGLTTGQSCTFTCVEGFKRNGPLQCVGDSETQSHNRWTYESATCEPVSCGDFPLSTIPNSDADTASEHCTNGEAGETCTFSCKLGYHQSGPAVTCTDVDGTGVWVSDGKSCNPFSCGPVDLNQMPNADASSTVSCNTLVTGQACDYTCAEEYEKFGDLNCIGVSTTGSGSIWDYGNTHCAAVSCGKYELCFHPSVNFASISTECNHGEIGDICSFSCLPGFVINEHSAGGDGPITCFSDGFSTSWRGGSHCESKPCPTINPARIPHADPVSIANCQVGTIGTSCPISCESGFGATGEIHCVVGSDGDPHLVYPQCLPTPCYDFDLSAIVHYNDEASASNCDVASPDEQCIFWCEPGWKRVGTTTCVRDPQGLGRWESTAACERLQCPVPDPSQIPHGQWTCGATLPGNQCTYECNDGYIPGGQLWCNELGLELAAWNYSSGPFCHPADCGAFYFSQVSSHAISSSQCTGSKTGDSCGFTCSGTFVATGGISCIPDDSESSHWDYAAATCATQCSPFQVPTHGNSASLSAKCNTGVLDDTCEWNCLPGYTQTVGTTICTNSGWSNTRACFESICGPVNLTSLPHANPATTSPCNSITGGGECEYECAQGYYKSGHLMCVGTPLRWTYEATECIAPSCGAFALCDIPNADQGSAGPHCLQATPGQTCDFKCVDGYRVENGPVTCVSAGGPASWTTNATCTPKPCPVVNPDRISNVNVPSLASCVNLKPGDSCSVTCQQGYGPTGELHCVATPEGNRLVYPQCIATPCTDFDLTSIPFYDDTKPTFNCDVAAQNEACEFECEYGYEKAGSVMCTTTSSGVHWTSDASCQQLVCSAPDSSHISHGSFSCGPTGVGDACSYTCNENYIHGGVFSCELINEEPGWNYDRPFCTACNCANEPELQLIPACSQCSPTAQSACQSCCNYLAASATSPCAYVAFYKAKQSHPNLISSLESTCSYTLSPECAGTCTDNRQRGLETGVDCGGNCPECPSSIVCDGPDCSTEGKTVGGGNPPSTIVVVVLSIVIAVCCGFLFYFWVIRRRREQEKKRVPQDDPEAASVKRESKNSDLRPDETELSDPPPLEAAGSGFHGSQY